MENKKEWTSFHCTIKYKVSLVQFGCIYSGLNGTDSIIHSPIYLDYDNRRS